MASPGRCKLFAAGTDPRGSCTINPVASCGRDGTCDGQGACRDYAAGTECAPATSCVGGMQTTAGTCDYDTCAPNYYDVDGNRTNGCEYQCTSNPNGKNTQDLAGPFMILDAFRPARPFRHRIDAA